MQLTVSGEALAVFGLGVLTAGSTWCSDVVADGVTGLSTALPFWLVFRVVIMLVLTCDCTVTIFCSVVLTAGSRWCSNVVADGVTVLSTGLPFWLVLHVVIMLVPSCGDTGVMKTEDGGVAFGVARVSTDECSWKRVWCERRHKNWRWVTHWACYVKWVNTNILIWIRYWCHENGRRRCSLWCS